MMRVPNRPRRRPPNHPAELDIADALGDLESALETRLECDGDPQCRVRRGVVENMLQAVRFQRSVFTASLERRTVKGPAVAKSLASCA